MANHTRCCRMCGRYFKEKTNVGGLSAKKAAAGALLAGPAGAVVGAAMGNTQKSNQCPYCGSYDTERV